MGLKKEYVIGVIIIIRGGQGSVRPDGMVQITGKIGTGESWNKGRIVPTRIFILIVHHFSSLAQRSQPCQLKKREVLEAA